MASMYRILLSTCVSSGGLVEIGLRHDQFTHVFVDEVLGYFPPVNFIYLSTRKTFCIIFSAVAIVSFFSRKKSQHCKRYHVKLFQFQLQHLLLQSPWVIVMLNQYLSHLPALNILFWFKQDSTFNCPTKPVHIYLII